MISIQISSKDSISKATYDDIHCLYYRYLKLDEKISSIPGILTKLYSEYEKVGVEDETIDLENKYVISAFKNQNDSKIVVAMGW